MDISIKQIVLFIAIILTGLSAGFFYAWQVSVIAGTKRVMDITYLETMQAINRAILNPAFFLIFFGSLIMLTISTAQHYQKGLIFWIMLLSTMVYFAGTFGVTALGNVPLNDSLDVINLKEMTAEKMAVTRINYEVKWNRLHLIRTVFAVFSFLLSLAALMAQSK